MKRMKYGIRQTFAVILMAGLMVFPVLCSAETTTEKITEQNKKIEDLQGQKQEADNKVGSIEEQKSNLETKLSGLNTSLNDLSNAIEDLSEQIADKQQEIQITEEELQTARETADRQYADMKTRIQFMYENGSESLMVTLLQSNSITDFLNKAEYVKEISEYDRNMLTQYENSIQEIEETQEVLETQHQELSTLEDETEGKKSQVAALISDTQTDISESAAKLEEAQNISNDIETQLAQEIEYERQLEQQKANEDAARLAEIAAQEAEIAAQAAAKAQQSQDVNADGATTDATEYSEGGAVAASDSDLTLLAALIYCEAGGESYEGQLAVGSVVVNRVKSNYFPNTVSGVIYQGGQFAPVTSGRLATVLAGGLTTDSCRQAASQVLSGNTSNSFLYFRRNDISFSFPVIVIGNQAFY